MKAVVGNWKLVALAVLALFMVGVLGSSVPAESKPSIESLIKDGNARMKIHSSLQKDIVRKMGSSPQEMTRVLIRTDEKNIGKLSRMVENEGGEVEGKYMIGDVISVEVPIGKIGEVAGYAETESIWPDRTYHVSLAESTVQINADARWSQGYDGSGMKIAILDSGIDKDHPMLRGRVVLEKDFSGEGYTYDVLGHGTHCAGIAAGSTAGGGLYNGVAPGAQLINAKVMNSEGEGTESEIIAGLNWALDPNGDGNIEDGADVISMSLGGPYADLDSPLASAVREAVSMGAVVVVAAGNCGRDCPSRDCNGYIGVETPGVVPEALTVGAVDKSGQWACFSSGGLVNGSVIKPDVVAPGVLISSSVPGGYDAWSGTSMAAPHVAGAVALLLQSNPDLRPSDVKYILERTAVPLGDPGKDVKYGSGLIDLSGLLPSNVNNILRYRVGFQKAVYQGDALEINMNDTLGTALKIRAEIRNPLNGTFTINFTRTSANGWKAFFGETGELGRYEMNIVILEVEGNEVAISESFDVIMYTPAGGMIRDVIVPAYVEYNETLPITVVFENSGNYSMGVTIEAQIWDGGIIAARETAGTVAADSTAVFDLEWKAVSPLGPKILRIIASFDGLYHESNRTFSVRDTYPPVIKSVEYEKDVMEGGPLTFTVEVSDIGGIDSADGAILSALSGYGMVLEEVCSYSDVHVLSGTIWGAEPGTYAVGVRVCDDDECTIYTGEDITVHACGRDRILVVSEHPTSEPGRFVELLEDAYCVSVLDAGAAPEIPQGYLSGFSAVLWITGNYFGTGVSDDAVPALSEYVDGGGRLLVEGPDVASKHVDDDLANFVIRSRIEEEMVLNGTVLMTKLHGHPILKEVPGSLAFNGSLCPYPDSVSPVNGGFELMGWENGNASIVISNDGNSKVIFLPFMLTALDEDLQAWIMNNMVGWLLEDAGTTDFVVRNITHGHLVEGSGTLYAYVERTGMTVTDITADVYVDGEFEKRAHLYLPLGENLVGLPVTLTSGRHSVRLEFLPEFSIKERNYVNNIMEKDVEVLERETDLRPLDVSYELSDSFANITAVVENHGGTSANGTVVDFLIDGASAGTRTVDIPYGEKVPVSYSWPRESGTFDLAVHVNPGHSVAESDYGNNNMAVKLYSCSRFSVLIVSDSDTEGQSTSNPDSMETFAEILNRNGYCVKTWNESDKGVPDLSYVNQFDVLIWSAGDYWNTVLNGSDAGLVEQYRGSIIFEGSDIAFDHKDDSLMRGSLHSVLDKDMILYNDTVLLSGNHEIVRGLSVRLDSGVCPFPDSVMPADGSGIAEWPGGGYAIITYNNSRKMVVYFAFSIDCVEPGSRETMVENAVEWAFVLPGDANKDRKVDIFDLALVGKNYGKTPSDEGWNPMIDMNSDGKISIMDLATVGKNYRRSYLIS